MLFHGRQIKNCFLILGPSEFIIPISPCSKLVVDKDAQIVEITYRNMISKLTNHEEFRIQYRELRNRHNQQIAERIHDMKKLSPPENYIKLIEKKHWIFEHAGEELTLVPPW